MLNVGSKCHLPWVMCMQYAIDGSKQHWDTAALHMFVPNYDLSQCVILRLRLDFGSPLPLID